MSRSRLQVSTRFLMLVVLVSAGLAWFVKYGSPFLLVPMALLAGMVAIYWRIARDRPWLAIQALVVAAALDFLGVAVACVISIGLDGYALMAIALVVFLPPTVGFGIAWANQATPTNAERRRPRWRAWSLVVALAVLPLTIFLDPWPFRLAFAVSRPALDAMADRVASGDRVSLPEWAGVYRILDSKYDPATREVALLLRDGSGFLRLPAGRNAARSHLYVNLKIDTPIGEGWRFMDED